MISPRKLAFSNERLVQAKGHLAGNIKSLMSKSVGTTLKSPGHSLPLQPSLYHMIVMRGANVCVTSCVITNSLRLCHPAYHILVNLSSTKPLLLWVFHHTPFSDTQLYTIKLLGNEDRSQSLIYTGRALAPLETDTNIRSILTTLTMTHAIMR